MNIYGVVECVNSEADASVAYKSDLEQYERPEYWEPANRYGDCEDYALLKRAFYTWAYTNSNLRSW